MSGPVYAVPLGVMILLSAALLLDRAVPSPHACKTCGGAVVKTTQLYVRGVPATSVCPWCQAIEYAAAPPWPEAPARRV